MEMENGKCEKEIGNRKWEIETVLKSKTDKISTKSMLLKLINLNHSKLVKYFVVRRNLHRAGYGAQRLLEMIEKDEELPFDLKDKIIFYAGPCPGVM